jgi:hypothetical protein
VQFFSTLSDVISNYYLYVVMNRMEQKARRGVTNEKEKEGGGGKLEKTLMLAKFHETGAEHGFLMSADSYLRPDWDSR